MAKATKDTETPATWAIIDSTSGNALIYGTCNEMTDVWNTIKKSKEEHEKLQAGGKHDQMPYYMGLIILHELCRFVNENNPVALLDMGADVRIDDAVYADSLIACSDSFELVEIDPTYLAKRY